VREAAFVLALLTSHLGVRVVATEVIASNNRLLDMLDARITNVPVSFYAWVRILTPHLGQVSHSPVDDFCRTEWEISAGKGDLSTFHTAAHTFPPCV